MEPGFINLDLFAAREIGLARSRGDQIEMNIKENERDFEPFWKLLHGYHLYHLPTRKNDARKKLEEVLSKDPTNLNATADLIIIYNEIYHYDEATRLQQSRSERLASTTPESKLIKAKCLAEQACALNSLMVDELDKVDNRKKIEDRFHKAFELSEEWEKCESHDAIVFTYYRSLFYNRLEGCYQRERDEHKASIYLKMSADGFCKIINQINKSLTKGDEFYLLHSWAYLGTLVNKDIQVHKSAAVIMDIFRKFDHLKYIYEEKCLGDSLKMSIPCFELALKGKLKHPDILVRKAEVMFSILKTTKSNLNDLCNEICGGLQDINEAINHKQCYIKALSWRIKFYILLCEKWENIDNMKKFKKALQERFAIENKNVLLKRARDDAKSVENGACFHSSNWLELAKVYRLSAKFYEAENKKKDESSAKHETEYKKKCEFIKTALVYLGIAIEQKCPNPPQIHFERGSCWETINHLKTAAECFKRAVEHDTESRGPQNGYSLLSALMKLYHGSKTSSDLENYPKVIIRYLELCFNVYKEDFNRQVTKLLGDHKNAKTIKTFFETIVKSRANERYKQLCIKMLDALKGQHEHFQRKLKLSKKQQNEKYVLDLLDTSLNSCMSQIQSKIEKGDTYMQLEYNWSKDYEKDKTWEKTDVGTTDVATDVATDEDCGMGDTSADDDPKACTAQSQSKSSQDTSPTQLPYGCDYHFYVIHSAKDEEWVECQLLSCLENEYNLKGCYRGRFVPGKLELEQMCWSIKRSLRVIVVLSEDYVTCTMSHYQTAVSLYNCLDENKQKILPIRFASLNVDQVPTKIKHLNAIKLNECIVNEEDMGRNRLNWNKLYRSIFAVDPIIDDN